MLCHGVVDLRKGGSGLLSLLPAVDFGTWYLFSNRRRNLLKGVLRDHSGYWVVSRRLHRGIFCWPEGASGLTAMGEEDVATLCRGGKIKRVAEHFCD